MPLEPITIDAKTFLRKDYLLPALPAAVHKIKAELMSEDANANQIAKLVGSEPALTAQVLRVVNSAYYSLPREVADIRFAVAFIGLHEVYRIVLAVSVINSLNLKDKNILKQFWVHSYFTAICAKFLAKLKEPHLALEELWSAALLHNIGSLVYVRFFPNHYREILRYGEENGCLQSAAESALNVPPSSLLGALLAEHWQLPLEVRQACENHDLEELRRLSNGGAKTAFRRIICLACLLSSLINSPLSEQVKQDIGNALQETLDLGQEQFLQVMASIYDLKQEADQFTNQMV